MRSTIVGNRGPQEWTLRDVHSTSKLMGFYRFARTNDLIPTGLDLKDNGTLLKRPRRGLNSALDADIGFVERLVWFWSNHFCVSPIRAACALSAEPMNARQSAPQNARQIRRHAGRG